jgi:flagellar hook-associated protein 1 FlgK
VLATTPNQLFGGIYYGSGLGVTSIESVRDRFLDLQILHTTAVKTGMDVRYQNLEGISPVFEPTGDSSLGVLVQKFFQGFRELSGRPEDVALRTNVVGRAQAMVNGLQERYDLLTRQRDQANMAVGSLVTQVNSLLDQITEVNAAIASEVPKGSNNDARDQRKALTDKLAGLIGITAYEASDGTYTITLDSGSGTLVVGSTSFSLSVSPNPLNNNYNDVQLALGGASTLNVTSLISGGELGARLDLRDNLLANFNRQLDQLAAGIQSNVNLLHRTGFALDGATTGLDFFRSGVANGANGLPPSVTAATFYNGAVNSLTVNAAIVADPTMIATAGVAGAPGDNAIVRAMASLETSTATVDTNGDGVADSGPFGTVVGMLVNSIGTESSRLQSNAATQESLLAALENQRQRMSGVDLDEEASRLISFQRAYQASARFLSVIDQLTEQLVNEFGR